MQLRIVGHRMPHLPGVALGVQRGRASAASFEPVETTSPPHAGEAEPAPVVVELDVEVRGEDFRGPYVQGRPGERFVYLVWRRDGVPFRRAKLMLPADLARRAEAQGGLVAELSLTDARGGPVCAAVRPPAITWSAG